MMKTYFVVFKIFVALIIHHNGDTSLDCSWSERRCCSIHCSRYCVQFVQADCDLFRDLCAVRSVINSDQVRRRNKKDHCKACGNKVRIVPGNT